MPIFPSDELLKSRAEYLAEDIRKQYEMLNSKIADDERVEIYFILQDGSSILANFIHPTDLDFIKIRPVDNPNEFYFLNCAACQIHFKISKIGKDSSEIKMGFGRDQ